MSISKVLSCLSLTLLSTSMMKVSLFMGLTPFLIYMKWWYVSHFGGLMVLSALLLSSSLIILQVAMSVHKMVMLISSSFIPIMVFMSGQWLIFFAFYELSLIPISWMIVSYGKQPERLRASRFIIMYTVLFSVPFLLSLQSLYSEYKVLWIAELALFASSRGVPVYCVAGIGLGLLVKIPLIFLHYWLPKAHVEASASGSVLLAGVLLKMGALGLFHLSYISFSVYGSVIWYFMISLSVAGATMSAAQAILSTDMKITVALASVSHMNFSLAVFWTFSFLSVKSFVMFNLAHSVVASALFLLVTEGYKSTNSRSILANKGVMGSSPLKSASYLLWAANMSLPPFLGFIAEVLGLLSISTVSVLVMIPILMYIILSSVYSLLNMMVLSSGVSWGIPQSMSVGAGIIFFVLTFIPLVLSLSPLCM